MFKRFFDDIQISNTFKSFLLFSILFLILIYTYKKILLKDSLYFDYFSDQLRDVRIEEFIQIQNKYYYLVYFITPIILFIKTTLITCCIMCGIILGDLEIDFSKIFKLVLWTNIITILSQLIKISWFGLFNTRYTLNELQTFSPLSIASLLPADINKAIQYPARIVDIFEILFFLFLAYGISRLSNRSLKYSIGLVAKTYGISFLIILMIISLASLNFHA